MITLFWKGSGTSPPDNGSLAKAIGQIIPMVIGCHEAVAGISEKIRVETRLVLR